MIAAAARTSGTSSPLASTLYRGRTVSAISRAVAIEWARASFAFRVSERSTEYSVRLGACGVAVTCVTRTARCELEDPTLVEARDLVLTGFRVAAELCATPKLTSPKSAKVTIQNCAFLLTWLTCQTCKPVSLGRVAL